jgi:16S rRNA processing protein RimM
MDDDVIAIGRILRAHGLHGECLTELFGESLFMVELPWEVILITVLGVELKCRILDYREVAGGRVLLRLEEIESREDAKKWQGAILAIKESSLPQLDKDEVREYELVGAHLVDSKGRLLGVISEVFSAGSETVLSIKTDNNKEVLLPFVKALISGFKRETEQLIVKLKASVNWEEFKKQEE